MKKHFLKKIHSKAGESFAEVLIALLVVIFGSLLLANMISASRKIVSRSADKEDARNKCLAVLDEILAGGDQPESLPDGLSVSESGTTVKISNLNTDTKVTIGSRAYAAIGGYSVNSFTLEGDDAGYESLQVYHLQN